MAISALHITAATILLSVLWHIQPSSAFIIQCENCRCLPDYCSQNVPHSTCPCGVQNYRPVTCTSSSATSINDLINQLRMSQQQPHGQSQVAFNMQSPIIHATSLSNLGQSAATSSSSLLSVHNSPQLAGHGQFQNTYTQQPIFGTWGNLQSAVSNQQLLQNFGNARLVLRVPISILANCPLRANACPFGNPSIQAVDNCNFFPNTAGVRCITSEEIRRLFICSR